MIVVDGLCCSHTNHTRAVAVWTQTADHTRMSVVVDTADHKLTLTQGQWSVVVDTADHTLTHSQGQWSAVGHTLTQGQWSVL